MLLLMTPDLKHVSPFCCKRPHLLRLSVLAHSVSIVIVPLGVSVAGQYLFILLWLQAEVATAQKMILQIPAQTEKPTWPKWVRLSLFSHRWSQPQGKCHRKATETATCVRDYTAIICVQWISFSICSDTKLAHTLSVLIYRCKHGSINALM